MKNAPFEDMAPVEKYVSSSNSTPPKFLRQKFLKNDAIGADEPFLLVGCTPPPKGTPPEIRPYLAC